MGSFEKLICGEQRQIFIEAQFLFEITVTGINLFSSLSHHLIFHPIQSAEAIDLGQHRTASFQDFLEEEKCQPSHRESEQGDS